MKKWVLLAGLVWPMTAAAQDQRPIAERNFVAIVHQARQAEENLQNPLMGANIQANETHQLCLDSNTLSPWIGGITNISLNPDGSVSVTILIGESVMIQGVGDDLVQGTPSFVSLSKMKPGDAVLFMGSIYSAYGSCPSDDGSNPAVFQMDITDVEPFNP